MIIVLAKILACLVAPVLRVRIHRNEGQNLPHGDVGRDRLQFGPLVRHGGQNGCLQQRGRHRAVCPGSPPVK